MMGCKMPWWAGSETPPPDKDKMIADLRAEVASLKEQNSAVTLASAHLINQLAAANGRLERYRGALQQVIVLDQPKYNYGNCADVARAALSDLPEADKNED